MNLNATNLTNRANFDTPSRDRRLSNFLILRELGADVTWHLPSRGDLTTRRNRRNRHGYRSTTG